MENNDSTTIDTNEMQKAITIIACLFFIDPQSKLRVVEQIPHCLNKGATLVNKILYHLYKSTHIPK